MGKRTLEQAFNAVFHDKEIFSDFCSLDLSKEISTLHVKDRELSRPSEKLKKFLRFLDKTILRYLQQDEHVVHSYIIGKSALTAVKAHAGNTHFFTTDIMSFFPCITKEDIKAILDKNVQHVPVKDIAVYIDRLADMMTSNNLLPIGFPTSPQLSNAFLFEFDQALHTYCRNLNYVYTRYSDDIVISSKSFDGFDKLEDRIQKLLKNQSSQLVINKEKTRFTHIGNKVKILGLVITQDGRVTIDSKYKKQLEILLHYYIKDRERFDRIVNEKYSGKEQSIFGLFHYAKAIDPSYLDVLQRKYGAYALKSLMKDRWHD